MHLSIQFAKQHWRAIGGSIVGLLVLYFLYEELSRQSAPAGTTATDLSGTANAVQSLSAAASLQNAQLNAQVETASYSANVANNQTAAQLQASLADTAAKLAATQQSTSAGLAVSLDQDATALSIQKVISDQAVSQTAIQGQTLVDLGQTAGQTQVQLAQVQAQVEQAQLSTVAKQIKNVQDYSKHAASDYSALAPVIAIETGQGYAAGQLASANTAQKIANSPGATVAGVGAGVGSAAKGIGSLLTGLFG